MSLQALTSTPQGSEMAEAERQDFVSSENKNADEMSHSTKFTHKDYTIGWICALPKEQTAATAMLDEIHPDLPSVPNDHNTYTLGSVHNHNVVIACLPKGRYGNNPAATVAAQMVATFPSIKVGLMVGIGGGIPPMVRLGDVVVSTPVDKYPGVIQWDRGKAEEGGSFRRTGALNNPPSVLLTALTKLETAHEMHESKIPQYLDDLKRNWPKLIPRYTWSDSLKDPLFVPKDAHTRQSIIIMLWEKILILFSFLFGWWAFNSMDRDTEYMSSNAVSTVTGEEKRNPRSIRVHYGLIASGNQVIKDTKLRDSLNESLDGNVLCVEMEAAGLMNDFPCIVIRGICDYADSQKNKDWQEYAAAVAAAYAKEFLEYVHPSEVDRERPVKDILDQVLDSIEDTRNGIDKLSLVSRQREVIKWLGPPDPSTNYNKALQLRHGSSGLWLLESNSFTKWKAQPHSFLWLNGLAGCGKTILSSAIIQGLRDTLSCQPLYFYFDFKDAGKQTLDSMVRSLISQLCCKCEDTWKPLDLLFSSHKDGHLQPSCESLCKALLQMMEQIEHVWIVLDALDECSTRSGPPTEGLLSWMRDLISQQKNVHLLVASRPEQDIESEIREWAPDGIVPIQADLIDNDIRAYVHTRVRTDSGLKRWRSHPDVQNEIENRLMEKADGMFRWAACQLDALENCLEYRSLQKALASLPESLDETYSRILHSIPPEHKQNAIRMLQFLTYSERPLSISEMVDAIAVDTEGDEYFNPKHRMPDPREITSFCSSLVFVTSTAPDSEGDDNEDDDEDDDEEDNEEHNEEDNYAELQLAHFSVKEYLTSERLDDDIAHNFRQGVAKASLAKVCLGYLLHFDQKLTYRRIYKMFPLAEYSALYWMDYAAMAERKDERLECFIVKLFCHRRESFWNCYDLCRPDSPWRPAYPWGRDNHNDSSEYASSALYYASFGGFANAVECILNQGVDVNAKGGHFGNALQAASFRGHAKIVELLLKEGADVNVQGGNYDNALHAAVFKGHEKIIELLLEQGARMNARLRVPSDCKEIIKGGLLVPSDCKEIIVKFETIVKLLLKHGADATVLYEWLARALGNFSFKGDVKTVELLLTKNVNIHTQSRVYGSALQVASLTGHEKIVELLLKEGADINAQCRQYGTALQAASIGGHAKIVELLLREGADFKVQGEWYGTAQLSALFGDREQTVAQLFKAGADIRWHALDDNLLDLASYNGHAQVIKILFHNDADFYTKDGWYEYLALTQDESHFRQVVKLLLDHLRRRLESTK